MNESRRRDLLSRYRIRSHSEHLWKKWGLWKAWWCWFLFFLLLVMLGFASPGARRMVESAAEGATSYAFTYLAVVLLFLALICAMFLRSEKASKLGEKLGGAAQVAAIGAVGMVAFGTVRVLESLLSSQLACVSLHSVLWLVLMPLLLVVFAIFSSVMFPAARRVGLGDQRSDSMPRIAAWILLVFISLSFFFVGDPYRIAGVDGYNNALRSLECLSN